MYLENLLLNMSVPFIAFKLDSLDHDQAIKLMEYGFNQSKARTVPMVFVNGKFYGGVQAVLDGLNDGSLQKLMQGDQQSTERRSVPQ